ncbi:unnamed protein product [Ascophyllum nodosum]
MATKDSTKIVDEVARQAIWAEVIKKENAVICQPHRFFLNPNKSVFMSRKPTEVDPRVYETDSLSEGQRVAAGEAFAVKSAQEVGRMQQGGTEHCALNAASAKLWKTEAQRWGSFYGERAPGTDPFTSQRSCWWKPRSTCDVTEYGDRYYEMTGTSPYARKHPETAKRGMK